MPQVAAFFKGIAKRRPELGRYASTFPSVAAVWDACPNAIWLLDMLEEAGYENEDALRLYACSAARLGQKYMIDPRLVEAIGRSEMYASHKTMKDHLFNAHARARVTLEMMRQNKHDWALLAAAKAACYASYISDEAQRFNMVAADVLGEVAELAGYIAQHQHKVNAAFHEGRTLFLAKAADSLRARIGNPFRDDPVLIIPTSLKSQTLRRWAKKVSLTYTTRRQNKLWWAALEDAAGEVVLTYSGRDLYSAAHALYRDALIKYPATGLPAPQIIKE